MQRIIKQKNLDKFKEKGWSVVEEVTKGQNYEALFLMEKADPEPPAPVVGKGKGKKKAEKQAAAGK